MIDKIGVEIECELSDGALDYFRGSDMVKLSDDGSISTCDDDEHTVELYDKEIISKPYESPKKLFPIFERLEKYESKGEYHYNDSMGFHVHISFVGVIPSAVCSQEFVRMFEDKCSKKYPSMWNRRIESRYCVPNSIDGKIEEPLTNDEIDEEIFGAIKGRTPRYRAINFTPLSGNNQGIYTVEFRIFATSKPQTMYNQLVWLVGLVKKWEAEANITRTIEAPLTRSRYKTTVELSAVDITAKFQHV